MAPPVPMLSKPRYTDDARATTTQARVRRCPSLPNTQHVHARTLRVGAGYVSTVDPSSGRETNTWIAPRDVPKVSAGRERDWSGGQLLVLHVAPWPAAPEWALQKVTLSCSCGEAAASMLAALGEAGVKVDNVEGGQ